MVWNPTPTFPITVRATTAPATFIFDREDGTIIAWNPTVDPVLSGQSTIVVDNSAASAVYKDLAFGTNVHGNFLFATKFLRARSRSTTRTLHRPRSTATSVIRTFPQASRHSASTTSTTIFL
jgi:hypothetical protein